MLKGGEIYKITSPSGKIYIGQALCTLSGGKKWGTNGRWMNHISKAIKGTDNIGKSSCRALDNAIRKYGCDKFIVEPILYVYNEDELDFYESLFIKEYNSLYPNGYNLTEGGSSKRWSDESRTRMSSIMKDVGGHIQSDDTKEKISISMAAKSKEFYRKRADARIGVPQAKQKRKNSEDNDLPKYISSVRENGIIKGYNVTGIPNIKPKRFTNSKLTITEKLDLANKYLLDAITGNSN